MRRLIVTLLAFTVAMLVAACVGDKPPREPASTSAPTSTPIQAQATGPAGGLEVTGSPGAVNESPTAETAEPVVYLIGLEDFPEETLVQLQTFFREEHGIAVGILPSISIDDSAVDDERQQLIADRLLDSIEKARGERRDLVFIGLTEYDMMMLGRPDWRWVFSLREEFEGVAVVSVARMDPRNFGLRPDPDLLLERATKMVGKNIGVLLLGLPPSQDPRSVMYDGLTSLDALDRVSDDFTLARE